MSDQLSIVVEDSSQSFLKRSRPVVLKVLLHPSLSLPHSFTTEKKTSMTRHAIFSKRQPGTLVERKNPSPKSGVLKKSLYFE